MQFQRFSSLLIIGVLAYIQVYAQAPDKQIVKITYTNSPVSQYRMTQDDMRSTPTKASVHEFMKGITDYYSLYINLTDRSSVYVLDSTVQVRPMGWENPKTTAALADSVLFTLKDPDNQTYKHEWIMNQTFFSEGKVGDIEWGLSNEEKTINGIKCLKAVAKKYPTMLTVWYTKSLPLSNGPSIYQGLPGLVIWAEDYFRTVQAQKIEYTNEVSAYNELYKKKLTVFAEQKKRGKYYDQESLLLVKKSDLANSSYEYYHKKPYSR